MSKILVMVLIFFGCLLVGCREERKPVRYDTKVTGYSGEAARNPYLAAEKLLNHYNKEVIESSIVRYDVGRYDAIVIPASVVQSSSTVRQIISYIEDGGHLVLLLENGDKSYDDFRSSSSEYSYYQDDEDYFDERTKYIQELLQAFDVELHLAEEKSYSGSNPFVEEKTTYEVPLSEEVNINFNEQELELSMGGDFYVTSSKEPESDIMLLDYQTDEGEEHKFLSKRYRHGGRLSLVSDARVFRNPHLGVKNHSSFLLALFETDYTILFTSGRHLSFYELVWKYYPYALLGVIFLTVVWAWGNAQRFGPILQLSLDAPLNYLKSIHASGHFLWKHKRESYLLAPMVARAKEVSRLANCSTEQMEQRMQQVSEEIEVPIEEVRNALGTSVDADPQEFIKNVQILQKTIQQYE